MLKAKRSLPTYNDGWLAVYRPKQARSRFGDAPATEKDLDLVCYVAFSEQSCREQDYEFAERESYNLSLKAKVRRRPDIDAGCKAAARGKLFDVKHVDPSGREMYLYMQEVGDFAAG